MKALLLLPLLVLCSCRYEFSPYAADVGELQLNTYTLEHIKRSEVSGDFKVAFIADTHNYYDDLVEAVEALNKNGPYAFVVICGDITNLGQAHEFEKTEELLGKLKYPYLVAAGNHDMISNGQRIFNRLYGPDNFSLVYKNSKFVFFNNNNWEVDGKAPNFDWVKSEVDAAVNDTPAKTAYLLSHIPVLDTERFTAAQNQRWRSEILNNTHYALYGHNHNPGTGSDGSTKLVTVGSVFKRVYFEVTISETTGAVINGSDRHVKF